MNFFFFTKQCIDRFKNQIAQTLTEKGKFPIQLLLISQHFQFIFKSYNCFYQYRLYKKNVYSILKTFILNIIHWPPYYGWWDYSSFLILLQLYPPNIIASSLWVKYWKDFKWWYKISGYIAVVAWMGFTCKESSLSFYLSMRFTLDDFSASQILGAYY